MHGTYAIDSSVAVEHLLKTSVGESFSQLLDRSRLVAPEVFDAEILSVLRRNVLRGSLVAERALGALDDLVKWRIDRVPHLSIVVDAWRHYQNVSAYDALYVATARLYGLPLLTLDGRLARATGTDVPIYDLRSTDVGSLLDG